MSEILNRFLERKKDPFLDIIFLEELERLKERRRLEEVVEEVKPKVELKIPKILPPVFTPFREPMQDKIVEPNSEDTVYLYEIPDGQIGYIQSVGNNSFEDAYLLWLVDGRQVIKTNITWDIASFNAPKSILPWIPVEHEVRWMGHNDSDKRVHFQILCDGFYTDIGNIEQLLGMGLPLGEF